MARILIAEDDRSSAKFIQHHLHNKGHDCVVERTGDAAMRRIQETDFDLVILDVMLPKMSGFEVCRRIRQDATLYMLPVLVVSAMNSEEEIMHGLAQGADDYVSKPVNIDNLLRRVDTLMRSRANAHTTDPLTNLPSADHTKRELQKRSCTRQPFGVVYVELPALRAFAYRYGADRRDEAIRSLGETLENQGRQLEAAEVFVGHMGGGHFVCLLPYGQTRAFCEAAYKKWQEDGAQRFRAPTSAQAGGEPASSEALDAMFCVTFRDANDVVTPQQLFEVLSQIRNKGHATKPSGIYVDQRTIIGA